MKLSAALIGLFATQALSTPIDADAAECGELGVIEWDLSTLPEGTDVTKLRKCREHPLHLERSSAAKRDGQIFERACRGSGPDYDYGCDKGWCWRNCSNPLGGKPWCWLAYEGGAGGWTPCGRWQDCEWSYNNKNAKCGTDNYNGKKGPDRTKCKSCGCSC